MSVAGILNAAGTISQQYLPTSPTPHPYVESISAGAGIAVSGTVQVPIVTNTGVGSVSAGAGISVGGTATAPVITNTGVGIQIYDATPSLALFKENTDQLGATSVNRILRVNYSTTVDPLNAQLFLPSPGTLNETYGLLFANVGGANTDDVDILFGSNVPPAVPVILFSVKPSSDGNKVYWITNIGPDSWVFWA